MKRFASLFLLPLSFVAMAQTPPAAPVPPIAIRTPEARSAKALVVASDALAGGTVPAESSQYGANRSIDLRWSAGPKGTRSYAVIAEDADIGRDGVPINHWIAYNIPASVRGLPPGLPAGADVPAVPGMKQVLTAASGGVLGYRGPRTPAGQTHHYHFQVFALDATVQPGDAPGRTALVAAIKGHVLAAGEIVATFTGPVAAQ